MEPVRVRHVDPSKCVHGELEEERLPRSFQLRLPLPDILLVFGVVT